MGTRVFSLLLVWATVLCVTAQDVLFLSGGGAQPNLVIQTGAVVYTQGGYVAQAGAAGMELDGELHVGTPAGFTANWTDNMASSSILSTSTGTVFFESNVQQNITATNTRFYRIWFNNSSPNTQGIRMLTNVVILNQATFQDGLVYANSYMMHINTTAAGAVTWVAPNTSTYSNSWVAAVHPNGRLDRDMTNTGSVFDFPVGSTSAAQLLQVTPTNIGTITRFSASWENGVVGTSPLVLTECTDPYNVINSGGEWRLRPANGGVLGSGSFTGGNMTLRGWNLSTFPGLVDNQFAMVWRRHNSTSASDWQVPNPGCVSLAPVGASGRTVGSNNVLRNNLLSFNDDNSQLAIGMTYYVLPVELTHFSGFQEGGENHLIWETAAEINSAYFELERSRDGITFQPFAWVAAAGHSIEPNSYTVIDRFPFAGSNYYRLRMVDRDGSYAYSSIVHLYILHDHAMELNIYPNPTADVLHIEKGSVDEQKVRVQVIDPLGRVVHQVYWQLNPGNNELALPVGHLLPAVYLLRLVNNDGGVLNVNSFVRTN